MKVESFRRGAISITGMTFLVFMGFEVIFFGYLLGRVRIKGVGLGTALVSVGYPIALIGIVISSQFFVLLLP